MRYSGHSVRDVASVKKLFVAAALAAACPAVASADTAPPPAAEPRGARWSMTLAGGALAPVMEMRDGYQDALVAGLRFGVRAPIGIGIQLAADYSPLPRRDAAGDASTTYGTVALVPAWTFGSGTVRFQLGAGGGMALERVTATTIEGEEVVEDHAEPAALGQVGLEIHVTRGGGLVLLGGATQTFGDREYRYAWGMGGLTLEF